MDALDGLNELDIRRLLQDNAAKLYRIDVSK